MEVKYWMSNLSHTINGMVCLPTFNCFHYGKWVSIYTIPMDLMGRVKKHVQHPQVVWVSQGRLFVIYLVRPKNNFPCKTRFTMIDKKSLVTRNVYFPSCELLSLPCKKKLRNKKQCIVTTTTKQLPTDQSTQRGARPVRWGFCFSAARTIWVMKSSNGWKLLPPHDDYSWSCERYGSWVSDFMGGHYCSWQFLMGWLMICSPCLECSKSCFTELPEKMDDKWWDVWDEIRIIQGFKLLIPTYRQIVCFGRKKYYMISESGVTLVSKKALHVSWHGGFDLGRVTN